MDADDLRVVLGVMANLEAQLMVPEDDAMPSLLARLARDLSRYGLRQGEDDLTALRALNQRFHAALDLPAPE